MGFFAVIFSLIIVIIQTTSILMGREAHEWTLPLLQVTPNTTYISQLNSLFENLDVPLNESAFPLLPLLNDPTDSNSSQPAQQDIQLWLQSIATATLDAVHNLTQESCVQHALLSHNHGPKKQFPVECLINTHQKQEIKRLVNEEFNPHLILLTLCVTHAIFCISKIKKTVWSTTTTAYGISPIGIQHPHSISLPLSATILYILLIIVFIIEGTRKNQGAELVQYPTILFAVVEMIGTSWFVYFMIKQNNKILAPQEEPGEDVATSQESGSHWFNSNHLQFVGIPTALLAMVVVGIRFWNDALTHLVFLSVACNALYLDLKIQDLYITKKILQLLYIALPIYSIYTAHIQWGDSDNWRYVIGVMGIAAITPFWMHPWVNAESESNSANYILLPKHLSKYSMFASSAALLSLVINLAMFLN